MNRISRCINALPGFQKFLIKATNENIQRDFWKTFQIGWTIKSEKLYKEYTFHKTVENLKKLLTSLDNTRCQKLIETVEHLNMKKSSLEAWTLLKKLKKQKK